MRAIGFLAAAVLFVMAVPTPTAASAAPESFGCTLIGSTVVLPGQPFKAPEGVNYTWANVSITASEARERNIIPWDQVGNKPLELEDVWGHSYAELDHLFCRTTRSFWVEVTLRVEDISGQPVYTMPHAFKRADEEQSNWKAIGYSRDAPKAQRLGGRTIYLGTPALIFKRPNGEEAIDRTFTVTDGPGYYELDPSVLLEDVDSFDTDALSAIGKLTTTSQSGYTDFDPNPAGYYTRRWAAYLPLAVRR